jgi:hypothetical protein
MTHVEEREMTLIGHAGDAEGDPPSAPPAAGRAHRLPGRSSRPVRSPRRLARRTVARRLLVGFGALAMTAVPRLQAQRTTYANWNAWFVLTGEVELTDRWTFLFDVSDRRSGPVDEIQALFGRVGASYALTPTVHVAVGGNRSESYPYGKVPTAYKTPEWRLWEHVQLSQHLGRLSLLHRYRFEQRFLGKSSTGDGAIDKWVHAGRFRYKISGTLPLRGRSVAPGGLYLTAADEIFVSYGPSVQNNVFDQNRAAVGIGRRLSSAWRMEVGYLDQLSLRSSGQEVERNHTVTLTMGYNHVLRK